MFIDAESLALLAVTLISTKCNIATDVQKGEVSWRIIAVTLGNWIGQRRPLPGYFKTIVVFYTRSAGVPDGVMSVRIAPTVFSCSVKSLTVTCCRVAGTE